MRNQKFNSVIEKFKRGEISRDEAKTLLNALINQNEHSSPSLPQQDPIETTQSVMIRPKSDIAVIGMSGQFPDAPDIDTFWQNLMQGHDAIHDLPTHYADQSQNMSSKNTMNLRGGVLTERDCFDPLFFNIAPREAESMNPHQRLILQESWKALEDAGYNPRKLADSQVGIFIGAEPTGYFYESFTGASDAIIASRLSYFLDLKGVALVVNTGCSSSGTAIHLACESLRNGESVVTIAGGVYASLSQSNLTPLADIGMLSPDGRCCAFDESANGTVLSEGIGIVVLKRLGDAISDGDHIYGVIRGTEINQDGASNGITAPNGIAQEQLITSVYKQFGVNPEEITYIEAHGTGTKLGDPVELNALVRAFKQFTNKAHYCMIGCVKPFIGHTAAASGVIGVIKVLLSMQNHQIPGLINFRKLNPLIELEDSAFYVNTSPVEWRSQNDKPLMAALNCFGHSGTNVHIVIQEYISPDETFFNQVRPKEGPVLVPISAKNKERLKEYVNNLLKYLKNSNVNLAALAYTLQIGREAMEERIVFFIHDLSELISKLEAFLADTDENANCWRGQVKSGKNPVHLFATDEDMQETVEKWIHKGKLRKIAELWTQGLEFDWNKLYGEIKPHRISLPTYPFAKERYWAPVVVRANKYPPVQAPIHPLLQQNTSDLSEQRYSSTFTGREFFLKDHVIMGQRILPGVAYLEMARAAVAAATKVADATNATTFDAASAGSSKESNTMIRIKNIIWVRPMWVGEQPVQVHIGLYPEDAGFKEAAAFGEGDDSAFFEGEIAYEIYSIVDTDEAEALRVHTRTVYSQGRAALVENREIPVLDLQAIRAECSQRNLSATEVYDFYKAIGVEYGPGHRGIETIYAGQGRVIAKLSLPDSSRAGARVAETEEQYVLHPGIMDAALQAAIGMEAGNGNTFLTKPSLPFTLQELEVYNHCTRNMWAVIEYSKGNMASDKVQKLDIDLCDEQGQVCVRMKGFSSRTLENGNAETGVAPAHTRRVIKNIMLEPVWQEQADSNPEANSRARKVPKYTQQLVILCEPESRECAQITPESIENELKRAFALGVKVLHLQTKQQGAERQGIEKRFEVYAVRIFEEIQKIFEAKPSGKTLVQVVVARQGEQQLFAGLSGMLKTAGMENPKVIGQLIEVEQWEDKAKLIAILVENTSIPTDNHIRYQEGKRLVADFSEVKVTEAVEIPWKDGGVYLITGGAGGLGMIFAKEIATQANGTILVLTGRSSLDKHRKASLMELELNGAKVRYRQVDVTDQKAVNELVGSIGAEFGKLDGIIHSAGIIRDNYITKKSQEEFIEVLGPKVTGLVNLDLASQDMHLDFMILFSSTSGSFGNPGQADYATANAFMDAYTKYRNGLVSSGQRHGRTLSINWPLWQEGGMRVDEAIEKMMKQTTGMAAMRTQTGIRALYEGMASGSDRIMVVEGDLTRMNQKLFSKVPQVSAQSERSVTVSPIPVAIDTGNLQDKVQDALKRTVSKLLKVKIESIDLSTELSEYGFDSISLTQFANILNEEYRLELDPTVFFEHPTLHSLAGYLVKEHQAVLAAKFKLQAGIETSSASEAAVVKEDRLFNHQPRRSRFIGKMLTPVVKTENTTNAIAIVGMSGIFPQARDLDEFWNNLLTEKDCITEIPKDRWDWKEYYGDPHQDVNKTNIKWGGFIDGVAEFDPLFFGISPREAELMDPLQRLLMTYIWKVIEDAGYSAESLSGTKTAIFVGTAATGYSEIIARANVPVEGFSSTGAAVSVGPNRMSYFLNIHGPSEPIETACSSSLVAIHRAVNAIENENCEMAIAGGINTILTPESHISFNKAGMLCEDGRCKTFSDKADGYVRGEGVGMLFLKRLKDAEEAGDHIYGIIRGTAENHGGRANSLTAPNPNAQAELLQTAYRTAGIDPRTVTYIEAHGTGTELGDPVEINGLKMAFKELYQATGDPAVLSSHCGLGSVKTNIGHLELAAGVAGVIKVLLQLKHKTLVKSLHCETINPYIQLKESPFYIVQEQREWEALQDADGREIPRRAGVSSFGFGGVNAHVVIEEYIPQTRQQSTNIITGQHPAIIILSAKTEEQLKERAEQLLTAIQSQRFSDADLADLAYTLQVGRKAMEERLGVITVSTGELTEKLAAFLAGQSGIENLYRGQVKRNQETFTVFTADEDLQKAVEAWVNKGKYSKLLDLWTKGLVFDWNRLYGENKPRRISLPAYPFAKERYWVPVGFFCDKPLQPAYIHPLLQQNTSNLSEQRYSSTFTGREFFLKDHVIMGQRVLPGVAYLEMARAAVAAALNSRAFNTDATNATTFDAASAGSSKKSNAMIRLRNVVWARPIGESEQPMQVHIGLYPEDDAFPKSGSSEITYKVYSITDMDETEASRARVVYSQGRAALVENPEIPVLDLRAIRAECSPRNLSAAEVYEFYKAIGVEYGPGHRGVEQIYAGQGQVIAKLSLPDSIAETEGQYVLHPGIMDAALQASIGMEAGDGNKSLTKPFLPCALQELEVYKRCTRNMWTVIEYSNGNMASDKVRKLDIDLCDEKGQVCVRMKGFSLRTLENGIAEAGVALEHGRHVIRNIMLEPVWQEQAAPNPEANNKVREYNKQLVILCEFDGITPESIENELKRAFARGVRVLHLQTKQKGIEKRFQTYAVRIFEEIQKILLDKPVGNVLIQLVVTIRGEHQLFSGLSGIIKTAQIENPRFIGQIIEIEPEEDTAGLIAKLKENSHISALHTGSSYWPMDNRVRYHQGKRQVTGWNEVTVAPETVVIPWKDGGVYLITGGAGGLGRIFAKEIAAQVKDVTLILTGRSSLDGHRKASLMELERGGAKVIYRQVDVTDKKAVNELIASIGAEFGRLDGIIHSAGVIRDNYILKKTKEELMEVLAPKVAGLVNLDIACIDLNLDFMILFSSIAGSFGNPGQADYATANAFMDAYAKYRNDLVNSGERKGRTLSINWPLWQEGGMRVDEIVKKMIRQSTGMTAMRTLTGIRGLYQALASFKDQVMIIEGELTKIKELFQANSSKVQTQQQVPVTIVASEALHEKTIYQLKALFGEVTKLATDRIENDEPLESYGIDSVMIIQLNQKLAEFFGRGSDNRSAASRELSKTIFYECLTLKAVAKYLVAEYPQECMEWTGIGGEIQTSAEVSGKTIQLDDGFPVLFARKHGKQPGRLKEFNINKENREPIAIIGLSGRYPQAKDMEVFWDNLVHGKDCITEIPVERWPLEGFYHSNPEEAVSLGKSYSKWGGFVEGFAEFDPLFFNISPREAFNMDPQERLFIESCWEVLEDAGYTREQLALKYHGRVGVFAGITKTGFNLYGPDLWRQGESIFPHTSFGSVANRVSYLLNLQGPSMPIDTMCSSSLTAIHEACEHLHRGECEMAIAGGVNLYLHPSSYIALCRQQMLSRDGQCKSFGKGGDGFVPGEGVGTVLLKPLSRAITDEDQIYAVIRGTSINHGGKTNGYTVPNPKAQEELIRTALEKSGVNARSVSYIEAHGTGTELGDPIEITGLTQAFRKDTADLGYCAIGSVKSNIGHLEAAAGIAGLTKIVLQMKHRQLVPSLHSKELNTNIDFIKTPFIIQQELTEWERPVITIDGVTKEYPRIAGISSFGAGGSNAHVIIEEYLIPERHQKTSDTTSRKPAAPKCAVLQHAAYTRIIVLSAKNEERLKEQAEQLLTAIQGGRLTDDQLVDLAYTLQVGREAMEERLGMTASSIKELTEKLQGFLENRDGSIELYRGQIKRNKETLAVLAVDEDMAQTVDVWISKKKYNKLLDLWVKGLAFDWNRAYGEIKPRRISLPTYPFAKESYWIPERYWVPEMETKVRTTADSISITAIHPLSHHGLTKEQPMAPVGIHSNLPGLKRRRVEMKGLSVAQCLEWDLKEHIGNLLKIPRAGIERDENLADLGFDSVSIAQLANQLTDFYGIEITPDLFFGYPTVERLIKYFLEQYGETIHELYRDGEAEIVISTKMQAPQRPIIRRPEFLMNAVQNHQEPIAIIGMSGRFPGARNIDELWTILATGQNMVKEIPQERFDWRQSYGVPVNGSGKTNYKWCGCIPGVREFDPLFFEISPYEAELMDPRQRLLLEESWKALEDAAYGPDQLITEKIGMFVGVQQGDYQLLTHGEGSISSNDNAILAARLAYFLDLKGPVLAIDTACSSSLAAAHQAILSLRAGECKTAIVAGVNLFLTPAMFIGMDQAGMLSADGKCYTFDKRANGTVPGEAVAAIVLKPLSQARADGDPIYAVIKGSGINYDGKTNGITAPSGVSQTELIKAVYDQFRVNPEEIEYIVTHGTGTKLGDPVEINALNDAFKNYGRPGVTKQGYCALTSTKTNFGHTMGTSGLVSLISLVQALRHEMIPASLHCEQENDYINWKESPFYVNKANKPWPERDGKVRTGSANEIGAAHRMGAGIPRMGAVSAFGMSGTNAHMVVESYPRKDDAQGLKEVFPNYLLAFSAKTREALEEKLKNMLAALENNDIEQDLIQVSYTLLTGRHHFNYRCATVVQDRGHAISVLKQILAGEKMPNVFQGKVPREFTGQTAIGQYAQDLLNESFRLRDNRNKYRETLFALADFYCQGYEMNWRQLFANIKMERIHLPTYPFARECYWFQEMETRGTPVDSVSTTPIHPLLRQKSSGLSEQRYSSAFTGREDFLEDYGELMTFEEIWGKESLPNEDASLNSTLNAKTLICFLSDPGNQQRFAETIRSYDPQIKIIFISQSMAYQRRSSQKYDICKADSNTYREAFRSIREDVFKDSRGGEAAAILYLWPLEDCGCIEDYACIVHILQAMGETKLAVKRIQLAAQFNSDGVERCYGESWIGFERSLRMVLPDLQISAIYQAFSPEIPSIGMEDWGAKIWAELHNTQAKTVLYQDNDRLVYRVRPTTIQAGAGLLKPGRTYLITGGCGGLGLLFAKHLAELSRETQPVNLILTGRTPLDAGKQSMIGTLESLGSQVVYVQADVSDPDAMREGLGRAAERFGAINGVIHAAGISGTQNIFENEVQNFHRVLEPKIKGTLLLDELLKAEPLDFTCYFSSTAAIIGDFGSCDYAIANRFLMAYAHHRDRQQQKGERRGKTFVINWPVWRDGGMGVGDAEKTEMYLKSSGQRFLESGEGLDLFDRILAQNSVRHVVFAGQPKAVHRFIGLAKETPTVSWTASVSDNRPNHEQGRRPEMKGLSVEQCLEWDLKWFINHLLKIPREKIDHEKNLAEFGFNSIGLTQFSIQLSKHYGIQEITPALFFMYPTIEKIGKYLLGKHRTVMQEFYRVEAEALERSGPVQVSQSGAISKPPIRNKIKAARFTVRNTRTDILEPIAVIGMSGRFPNADTVEELWDNLVNGRNCISEIPKERWDWREYYGDPSKEPNKTNSKWGGFIRGTDQFDPLFFEISPKEAEYMDPKQRVFLEEAWHCLEDAGYMGERIQGKRCGVYVGVEEGEYGLLSGGGFINSNQNATLPARIAYKLDLKGPNMALTASCSSGLVAIHQACQALRQGDCEMALAGGASLMLTPMLHIGMSQAGMLSPGSQCYIFDQRADGIVPGEAVAAVLLKPLSKAVLDQDHIYGCIKASGVNYNGKSNGIIAPNPLSQAELIQDVYDKYHINPEGIQYLIPHSVGSKLGDPMEIQVLTDTFAKYTARKQYCAIGSVKPLIGHAFAASGVVSLISMLMLMKHRTILAMKNFETGNEYIDFKNSPFIMNRENQEWISPHHQLRMGAISTTGTSGTNAHAVIEEYLSPEKDILEGRSVSPQVMVLSARNQDRLRAVVQQMLVLCERETVFLADMAYTLQIGREPMASRLAMVINDKRELIRGLKAYLNNAGGAKKTGTFPYYTGDPEDEPAEKRELFSGKAADTNVGMFLKEKNLEKIAHYWAKGGEIPWESLHEGETVRRIPLPTYPFAKERYWLSNVKADNQPIRFAHTGALQPSRGESGHFQNVGDELRPKNIRDYLIHYISQELNHAPDTIKINQNIGEYGANSITIIKMLRDIENRFDVKITGREMLVLKTIESIATYLAQKIAGAEHPGNIQNQTERLEIKTSTVTENRNDPDAEILEKFKNGTITLEEAKELI